MHKKKLQQVAKESYRTFLFLCVLFYRKEFVLEVKGGKNKAPKKA